MLVTQGDCLDLDPTGGKVMPRATMCYRNYMHSFAITRLSVPHYLRFFNSIDCCLRLEWPLYLLATTPMPLCTKRIKWQSLPLSKS